MSLDGAKSGLTVRNVDVWTAHTATAPNVPVLVRARRWALPVKAAYALLRVEQRCAKIVDELEAERVALCEALTARDAEGALIIVNGVYSITPEDTLEINAAFAARLAEEVVLPGCRAVTLAELGDAVRLSADDIALLGPFVVEE